ncbi:uncharacterized protein [Haliotis cracherodii]|uniref:uncharacterized protein n=1 Tax=Haliotis cracherodii TaxID=6455 RepID=UPI0039E8478C
MGENMNIKIETFEANIEDFMGSRGGAGPAPDGWQAETALDTERFHHNFFSSGQASYILSEGHYSSDPGASEKIESTEDISEDSQDKDWKVSYLDYQVDSDEEEIETASDRDLDPDYDKSPDPDWDDGDSWDSDYKHGSRSARRKRSFRGRGRGRGRGRSRDTCQSRIDRLKYSLREVDVVSFASNVKGGKDISNLHSLVAKGMFGQYRKLLRQDVTDKVKKESDETLRKTVKNVLSGRNLLPSLCSSDISPATVKSVANILHEDNALEESVQSSVVSGSHPSASLLLQSLIRTVQDKDPGKNDFPLQSSNSSTTSVASVSTDGGKQNLEGISGRSFLLLQHIALQEHQKKQRSGSFLSFTRFLSPNAYSSSNGGSVLKSMLTEDLGSTSDVTNQRTDTRLLRKMLETTYVPPNETSCEGSALSKFTDEKRETKRPLSLETFEGYTVYVDQATSDDDVDDGDLDDDDKDGSECQQILEEPDVEMVNIKTEPVSPRRRYTAESSPQIIPIPIMQIKPEPLSPKTGAEDDSLATQETPSRECEDSDSVYDQNIRIKKEPDLHSTEESKEDEEDSHSQPEGFHHARLDSAGTHHVEQSSDLALGSPLETMQVKSEPFSPMLPTPQDPWTNSCHGEASPNISKNISKIQSSDIPNLNLRSLLVNDETTLKSMLKQRTQYSDNQSTNNVDFQNFLKPKQGRPHYEQTLSQKIAALKKEVTSEGGTNGPRDDSGSEFEVSASTFLQSLSRLSSSSSGNKDTILRGLMEVKASTNLDSPSHSYNTRHKRKHQDLSLLGEDQGTPSVKQESSASNYDLRDSAEAVPLNQFESMSQAINHDRANVDGLQELDMCESLSRNVNSCSQQLLNIIKSVGASKVSEEPKKQNVTILQSMLNCVNEGENSEPFAKTPKMSGLLDTTTSTIGIGSTNFLSQSHISPQVQRSHSQVRTAKQVSKFRMIRPKPFTIGTSTQTQMASLRIGLRKRRSRSADKSSFRDVGSGVSALPTECPYQCRLCGSAFRSTSLLEEHMHVHFGSMPFGCSICPQSFMTAKELEDHTKVHVSKLSPAVVYKCTVCGDVFDTKREHNEHRITHETIQQFQSKDLKKQRGSQHVTDQVHKLKDVHTCKQCGEVFHDIHKYVLHVDQHNGWYKCEKCDKVLVSKDEFQGHILNCSGQNYICSECGKSFMRKVELNYHIMFLHKQQSVTCGVCRAVFCYESHLEEHELEQHSSELQMMLQGESSQQPNTVGDLSTENGCKISDSLSLSVQRSSGSVAISDFSVQCMSEPAESEVLTISDSE